LFIFCEKEIAMKLTTYSALKLPKCKNVGTKGGLPPLKGASGLTDFPTKGEDRQISFENSQYALFPLDLAVELARAYPVAWCRGGNHFGNYAFKHYFNAMKAIQAGDPIPAQSLRWMKKRERYIARHRKDFRLAGVIAMIKWAGFVDADGEGSLNGDSLGYMLDVVIDFGR
jgi:hypothetical protein